MPSSQLPRVPYDKWVYDFSGIVGGYGLRPMSSHFARASCDFWGWSGGAMVLGKLPEPGRPTIWITVGHGPIALAVLQ